MTARKHRQWMTLIALILAGEGIFLLPFVVIRLFRPTVLSAFDLTNLELGLAQSIYGITAMIAYFLGGPLADRYSAKRLMTVSLLATAAGGFVLVSNPSFRQLQILYGYWGFSTILLFWSPLIRATRFWGGEAKQGVAFGVLDGGRGLFAALLGSASVLLLDRMLPKDTVSVGQQEAAMDQVIFLFMGTTVVVALLVWFFVPDDQGEESSESRANLGHLKAVMSNPRVWLQALIVLCAYVGYKSVDDYGLFGRDVLGYDDVEASSLSSLALYVRVPAAIVAGWLGDRLRPVPVMAVGFGLVIAGNLLFASNALTPSLWGFLVANVVVTCLGIYGLRGLYFAIFSQAKVPLAHTGTAAGLVSVFGYTPDVFVSPAMGYFTDTYPGALGHQLIFGSVAAVAGIGLVATLLFGHLSREPRGSLPRSPAQ